MRMMKDTKNTTTSTETNNKMAQGMKIYILICLAVCTNAAYMAAQNTFPQGKVGDLSTNYVAMDAVFNGDGTIVDMSTTRNNTTNYGTHVDAVLQKKGNGPKINWNAEFGRFAFTQEGAWASNTTGSPNASWYEWKPTDKEWSALSDGCALEAFIRTPSTIGDGEAKILSATQGGGISLMISGSSATNPAGSFTAHAITFLVGVSESSKNQYYWCCAPTAVEPDTYYHIVGVYGGTDKYLHLYVNGKKVKEVTGVTGTGMYLPTNANAKRFCIAADPTTDASTAESFFPGEILLARVYTSRLGPSHETTSTIEALYNNIKIKRTSLKADLMDIVFDGQGIARDMSEMNNNVTAWTNPNNTSVSELTGTKITTSNTWEPKFDYNYGRYVLNNNSVGYWGTYAKRYYRVDYKNNAKMKKALQDGFTMEVIANCNIDPTATDKGHSGDEAEAKWFSSVQSGGTSIMAGVAGSTRDDRMNFVVHTTGVDHYIGTDIIGDANLKIIGSNYAAEIGREVNTMKQTISNLPAGKYKVVCQGFQTSGSNASLYAKSGETTAKQSLAVMSDVSQLNTLVSEDKATFSADNTDNVTNLRNYNTNAAAARLLASSGTTRAGETYSNEVMIDVADGGSLEIGLTKENADGRAYVDNFQLFKVEYNKELYLSATKTQQESRDCKAYSGETVSFILRRAFDQGKWNALSLPCDIPGSELKSQFGDGVQLYKLKGIDEKSSSVIRFTKVDIDADGLKANECYVIKPVKLCGNEYDYNNGSGTPYEYNFIDETEDVTIKTYNPLYFFNNVTQTAAYNTSYTKNYATSTGTLKFTAYYGKPSSVAAHTYIVENGDMYYLQSEYDKLYASYWTLEDVVNPTKSYRMMIDDDEATGISASEFIPVADKKMYNLNGQRVADNSNANYLPKGIYITNGRKVVVK